MSPIWVVVLIALSFGQLVNGACHECKVDVCFILDQSGSISEWESARTVISKLVGMMDIGKDATQVGLLQFAGQAQPEWDLDDHDNQADVLAAVAGLVQVGGSTKLRTGLDAVLTDCFGAGHGERTGVPKLAIMLTDGKSTVGGDDPGGAATAVRNAGINLLAVGVKNPDQPTIKLIANQVADDYFLVGTDYTYSSVVTAVFDRYKDFCAHECKIDLCIVLDQSGSVTEWNEARDLIKELVTRMDVGPSATQIGLVQFNGHAAPQWDLDDNPSLADVIAGVNGLQQSGLATNIARGVESGRTDCFGPGNGQRAGAKKLMLVITDGKSTVFPDDVDTAAQDARDDEITILAVGVKNPRETTIDILTNNIVENKFLVRPGDYDWITVVTAVISRYHDFCPNDCQIDLCVVLDQSGSITTFNEARGMVAQIISRLNIGPAATQVGMVMFDGKSYPQWDLNAFGDSNSLLAAINALQQSGLATRISEGIDDGRTDCFGPGHGERPGVPKVMLVVTDGKSTVFPDPVKASADAARDKGITLLSVGIHNPDVPTINDITDGISANTFLVKTGHFDFTDVVPAVVSRLHDFCDHNCRVDMCVVLDESGSVTNFDEARKMVHDIVSHFDIGPHAVQVGLVLFNGHGNPQWTLDAHSDQASLLAAINGLAPSSQTTNIASGINAARTDCFGTANGERAGIPKLMLVVTDGKTTVWPDNVQGASDGARGDGITVLAVGIHNPNEATIDIIADNKAENTFLVKSGEFTFDTVVPAVVDRIEDFCPHACEADICFILDMSGSVTEWQDAVKLLQDLVSMMDIGPTATQVGLVQFDGKAHPEWDLDDHATQSAVIAAIGNLQQSALSTKVKAGIDSGTTDCFGTGHGERGGAVPKLMVVLTDGKSTVFPDNVAAAADAARALGITLLAVGVKNPRESTIDEITGNVDANKFMTGSGNPFDYDTVVPAVMARYRELCHIICGPLEPINVVTCSVVTYDAAEPLRDFDGNHVAIPDEKVKLLAYNQKVYHNCKFKVAWDKRVNPQVPFNADWMSIAVAQDPTPGRDEWFYRKLEFGRDPNVDKKPTQNGVDCDINGDANCVNDWPAPSPFPYIIQRGAFKFATLSEISLKNQYDVNIHPDNVVAHCGGTDDNPDYHLRYFFNPGANGVRMHVTVNRAFYTKHKDDLKGYCVPP